jgi:hypothetical protein
MTMTHHVTINIPGWKMTANVIKQLPDGMLVNTIGGMARIQFNGAGIKLIDTCPTTKQIRSITIK